MLFTSYQLKTQYFTDQTYPDPHKDGFSSTIQLNRRDRGWRVTLANPLSIKCLCRIVFNLWTNSFSFFSQKLLFSLTATSWHLGVWLDVKISNDQLWNYCVHIQGITWETKMLRKNKSDAPTLCVPATSSLCTIAFRLKDGKILHYGDLYRLYVGDWLFFFREMLFQISSRLPQWTSGFGDRTFPAIWGAGLFLGWEMRLAEKDVCDK